MKSSRAKGQILIVSSSIILAIALFFVVSGNKQEILSENYYDDFLLKDSTCAPPCLYNIYPGATKVDDAIEILQVLEKNNHGSKLEIFEKELFWRDPPKKFVFSYFNDVVVRIKISDLHRSGNDFYLSDLIKELGEPDAYFVECDEDCSLVTFIFPSHGVLATFGQSVEENEFDIHPTMRALQIIFIKESDDLDHFLELFAGTYVKNRETEHWNYRYYIWEGYADFSFGY